MGRGSTLGCRSRVTDWGVHVGVFLLCALSYAAAFDRLPQGFPATVLWLVLLQLLCYPGGYLLNDYTDFDSDRSKVRHLTTELRRPKRWIILVLFLGGLAVALGSSRPALLACWAVTAAAAIAYSVPPLRLKVRGLAGVATAALTQRLPFFLALCASHPVRSMAAALLTTYLGCTGVLFILHHQVTDLEMDRATGTPTWAVHRGRLTIHRFLLIARGVLIVLVAGAWLLTQDRASPWRLSSRFALGYTGLVMITLLLFYVRHGARRTGLALVQTPPPAANPRRFVAEPARILGAGAAGLMAGIKLAEWGVRVEVHEAGAALGGMHQRVEGVHFTHVDPARLSAVLGFDVAPVFSRVDVERGYLRGRHFGPRWRAAWVCRRGGSAGTLDRFLYDALVQRGGCVYLASRPDWAASASPPRCILATGLDVRAFRRLGLPSRRILGYHAQATGRPGTFTFHYRDPRLGKDYAYAAGVGGHGYVLVFSRDDLPESAARVAAEMMHRTEGIEIAEWVGLEGAVPLRPRLFHEGAILTGTLAGMIDPFHLSGLSGALVSGWLAALAVEQPERAQDEFRWACRNWTLSTGLSRCAQRHPGNPWIYLGTASIHAALTPVGVP